MLTSILRGLTGKVAVSVIVAFATVAGTILATNFPDIHRAICQRG